MSNRICETCVYCSFAGSCDRYDKQLTSIEQPACDAYEIHPLLAENDKLSTENDKLRELLQESLMDYRQYAEKYGLQPYLSDVNEHLDARLRELEIEVPE